MATEEKPQRITAEKLCTLTGLTDRRHRQLAKDGWFPHPSKEGYLLTPTIAGMLKYYRESFQKTSRTLAEDKQVKLKKEIELLDLKIEEQNRQLVPIVEVDRVWGAVCVAVRQWLLVDENIPQKSKDTLLKQFSSVQVADFYRKDPDEEGDPVPETD